MSNPLQIPVITAAGAQADIEAYTGGKVKISHVALGDGRAIDTHDVDGKPTPQAVSATALQNLRLLVPVDETRSAKVNGQILIYIVVPSSVENFIVSEIGIMTEDGILFAYTASSTENLGLVNESTSYEYALAMRPVSVNADNIELVFENGGTGVFQQMIIDAVLNNVGKINPPIIVSPINGASDVATTGLVLIANPFNSPAGYEHIASRWIVCDDSDTEIYDSGSVAASVSHALPADLLSPSTSYSWKVAYQGRLGTTM